MSHPTVKGVVIHPDATHEVRMFKQLKDYQDAVGGYIEGVRFYNYNADDVAQAYVNEEGWLTNEPSMNPLASALSFLFGNNPTLAGSMVIVGKSDDEGYDTDIPEWLLTLITHISQPKGDE